MSGGKQQSRSRLKAADRVRRDAGIREERAAGMDWATIAAGHGITPRRAREIWAEGSGASVDPIEDATAILAATLARYSYWEAELEGLYARTRNPAVQLGAIKTGLQLVRDRSALLQSTGAMDARALRASVMDRDAMATARAVLDVFKERDVPMETQEALIEAIERQLPPGRPRVELSPPPKGGQQG